MWRLYWCAVQGLRMKGVRFNIGLVILAIGVFYVLPGVGAPSCVVGQGILYP